MIVRNESTHLRVITQTDHAHFAGELLALWRRDGMPDHERRADLLFAAREHDNGWREMDAAPACDPDSGKPYDFRSLPVERRAEIWERGSARFADQHPYAALLVTLHALNLLGAGGAERWGELIERLGERRDELLATAGVAEETAREDYRFIDLTDTLSLAACEGWDDPFERRAVKGRYDAEIHTLYVDPFPLAGTTTFQVPARSIERRAYAGDADLGGELAAARWDELTVRVAPRAEAEHLAGAATEPP